MRQETVRAKSDGIDAPAMEAAARPDRDRTKRAGDSRARYNRAMRLVRRLHLYAGLFMTPWVFLYGVTALLFNHPEVWSEQVTGEIPPQAIAGTPLASFPEPAALAQRVVDAINRRAQLAGDANAAPYELIRKDEAEYTRDLILTLADGDRSHTLRIDLWNHSGTTRTSTNAAKQKPSASAPFEARNGLALEPPPLEPVYDAMPMLLPKLGIPANVWRRPERPRPVETAGRSAGSRPAMGDRTAAPTNPRVAPEVAFFLQRGEQAWRATYNLQTGTLMGREADSSDSGAVLSPRNFLLRLHLAHGYPDEKNARWIWAIAVDAMFVSMVGWGITGLLMWWQMKNVRRVGAIVLVASAITAISVAIGMHGMMVQGL